VISRRAASRSARPGSASHWRVAPRSIATMAVAARGGVGAGAEEPVGDAAGQQVDAAAQAVVQLADCPAFSTGGLGGHAFGGSAPGRRLRLMSLACPCRARELACCPIRRLSWYRIRGVGVGELLFGQQEGEHEPDGEHGEQVAEDRRQRLLVSLDHEVVGVGGQGAGQAGVMALTPPMDFSALAGRWLASSPVSRWLKTAPMAALPARGERDAFGAGRAVGRAAAKLSDHAGDLRRWSSLTFPAGSLVDLPG
jgi:hypothetical protein